MNVFYTMEEYEKRRKIFERVFDRYMPSTDALEMLIFFDETILFTKNQTRSEMIDKEIFNINEKISELSEQKTLLLSNYKDLDEIGGRRILEL